MILNSIAISFTQLPEITTNLDLLPPVGINIKEEPDSDTKPATVRGRVVDESKPETFNQVSYIVCLLI